jgi:hypothetical protein
MAWLSEQGVTNNSLLVQEQRQQRAVVAMVILGCFSCHCSATYCALLRSMPLCCAVLCPG